MNTTTEATTPGRRSAVTHTRTRRRWWRLAGVATGVLVLLYGAIGWYVSGQVIDSQRVPTTASPFDTDVLSVSDAAVVVVPPDTADAAADVDAVTGLRWDGGYAQVGPTTSTEGQAQTRSFELLTGSPPPRGEDTAQFHGHAFPPDPEAAGFVVDTVTYPAPGGELEAWYLPGDGSTWVVAVHGRGETRAEMLRVADGIRELRYPTLIVQYRNDPGAPSSNDGVMLAGQEEWVDVDAAVDHALANGADDVVVFGNSLGGAIALSHAMQDDRDVVRGLVLDAPMADLREIVQQRSGEALPVGGPIGDSILAVGRLVTWLRTGLDFDTVDYVERAAELDVPVLVFHGTDDRSVPVSISEDLAAARPDLVEFHPVPDAAHVRAWNEDPATYTDVVSAFLDRLGRA